MQLMKLLVIKKTKKVVGNMTKSYYFFILLFINRAQTKPKVVFYEINGFMKPSIFDGGDEGLSSMCFYTVQQVLYTLNATIYSCFYAQYQAQVNM